MKRFLLLSLFLSGALRAGAGEFSITVVPNASISYRALPQSIVDRASGETSPVYRMDWRQSRSADGYWGLALIHSNVFGGGRTALETVSDAAGGTRQTDLLNAGFTHLLVSYRRPVAAVPGIEWAAETGVFRQIMTSKNFDLQGTPAPGLDNVNELSAEGAGIGLEGRHGGGLYGIWQLEALQLFQLFNAETRAAAGRFLRGEIGAGVTVGGWFSVEAGGYRQDCVLRGRGDQAVYIPGTQGAVVAWNRQETRASGIFVTLRRAWF